MSDLFIQIKDFFLTLILGILAGLVFHYYQRTIVKARVGKYPLYILDFFLWIIMICVVFFAMLWINQGEMRLYVLIALVAGLFIYYYYFSKRLNKLVEASANLTLKVAKLLVNSIKKPLLLVSNFIKKLITTRKSPPPDDNEV